MKEKTITVDMISIPDSTENIRKYKKRKKEHKNFVTRGKNDICIRKIKSKNVQL